MDRLLGHGFDAAIRHLLGGLHLMLWPLGLVISIVISLHVLLTKRDIGSAVGWAGLAWFSPYFGGVLYFILGINRVRRRARKLRGPEGANEEQAEAAARPDNHLSPLEVAARTITRRPALAGNQITMFSDGDEAYPVMLAAIAAARTSVALSTYIMRDDAAGGRFIDALSAAQQRGVAVRVLLDGIGSGYFRCPAATRLASEGVPVRRFLHSPLPWRMPFLNLRTHKKVLVIDGCVGFTGGMNIAYQNMVALKPPNPVRDTHFRVAGPVVGQLMEAFAEDWNFASDETLEGDAWFPDIGEADASEPTGTARIVTSGPDADLEKIEMIVLAALACARRSVLLMTPYFLPEERLITSLALAAMRGVAVDIVIPERSDHRLVDWATRANVGPLLDQGCRLWRNGPTFDHSKLLVLDGEWCLLGSQNWDMRSFRLNFELDMEVYHSDLARRLEAHINGRRTGPITREEVEGRPLPLRVRDAAIRLMLPYL